MWGSQDGGDASDSIGTITGPSSSSGWCRVEWDKGGSNSYRVGENGAYDLCVVSAVPSSSVSSSRCFGSCGCTGISGSHGNISDGPGNYDNGEDCTWVLVAEDGVSPISLTFTSFETESGYDFVTIYSCETANCSSMTEHLVARLDGFVSLSTVYTSSTTVMKVHFTSDGSVTRPGFAATWATASDASEFEDHSSDSSSCIDYAVCQSASGITYIANCSTEKIMMWEDSYGDSCLDYNDNIHWCSSAPGWTNWGYDASEICCACGGGRNISDLLSHAPSLSRSIGGNGVEAASTSGAAGLCGDYNVDSGEECDDGNEVDGDGCSASCTIESSSGMLCLTSASLSLCILRQSVLFIGTLLVTLALCVFTLVYLGFRSHPFSLSFSLCLDLGFRVLSRARACAIQVCLSERYRNSVCFTVC